MTQQLLNLPLLFEPVDPAIQRPAAVKPAAINTTRYHQAIQSALNIHGLSPSVYAVMASIATQTLIQDPETGRPRGYATLIDTARSLATTCNAVHQHLIGSRIFFDEIALPPGASCRERRRWTLSTEAIQIMKKVQLTAKKRYELLTHTAPQKR